LQLYFSRSRHFLCAEERFERAEEDRSGLAFRLTGNIQAVVIAVDEIDVGVAGWAEENGGAGGIASSGVGGGIGFSEIGLNLDDAAEKGNFPVPHEHLAEEVAGDAPGITGEESAGKGKGGVGLASGGQVHFFYGQVLM